MRTKPSACRVLETKSGEISYELVRSSRRRTIEIAIMPGQNVRVTAPRYALVKDITAFIQEKSDWIKNKLQEAQKQWDKLSVRKYQQGHTFLFLGEHYPLDIQSGKNMRPQVRFDEHGWHVVLPQDQDPAQQEAVVKDALIKWYRKEAEEVLGTRLFHLAREMKREPLKIAIRTQKRIWGNCDHRNKKIHLNWLLILAPMYVIDYVLIHELCHLDVPNHSTRFWDNVAQYMPEYKAAKQWLKVHVDDCVLP